MLWLGLRTGCVRFITSVLAKGKRWVEKEKKFCYRDDWRLQDEEKGESNARRTANELRNAMNSVFPNIQFTTEIEEDFETGRLPTLDVEIWMEKGENGKRGKLIYSFFEKKMKNPYCVMQKSAMPEKSKISTLAQDLIRRMINTSEMVSQEERDGIIENYIDRLAVSGYSKAQIREIVQSGLLGYQTKLIKAEKAGENLHRGAASTLAQRQKKKLLEKVTWYKKKKRKNGDRDDQEKRGGRRINRNGKSPPPPIVSVLFIPKTHGGELAMRLRQAEEEVSALTGDKVKIVERSGVMLKRILHKSNPWAGTKCDRDDCLVCSLGGENVGSCRQRNIVYRTTCLLCKEKGESRDYYGESSRTPYERGAEHLKDYLGEKEDSHMLKHHIEEHGDVMEPVEFSMKVIKNHFTAFSRQVHEAVIIYRNEENGILNSKSQYNRCQLPRLTVMMGEREMREEKEDMPELDVETEIEEMRNKKRKEKADCQTTTEKDWKMSHPPPTKKRRRWLKEIPKKRKRKEKIKNVDEEEEEGKKTKKIRLQTDMVPKVQEERNNQNKKSADTAQASNPDELNVHEDLGRINTLDLKLFPLFRKICKGTTEIKSPVFTAVIGGSLANKKPKPKNKAHHSLSSAYHHPPPTSPRGVISSRLKIKKSQKQVISKPINSYFLPAIREDTRATNSETKDDPNYPPNPSEKDS